MSELKPCPFCGENPISHNQLVACVYFSCGVNPSIKLGSYEESKHEWNQRAETETEKRLTTIATKHATRADELYEALDNLLELIDSCEGLAGINRSQYIIEPNELSAVVEAKDTLDKSRIEAERADGICN